MFIKLTLICLAIVPLIIGEESENPIVNATTRVGKFFGLLSAHTKIAESVKLFSGKSRHWKGELSFSFGRRPLVASGEFHQQLSFQRPYNNIPSALQISPQFDVEPNDSDPSNGTLGTHDAETTEETPLESTMQPSSRALKLEDYDEITFDPDVDSNRGRREATSKGNVKNQSLRADDDDNSVDSTTTVESSTNPMKILEEISVTISPPSSQQDLPYASPTYNHLFPYPPSINPSAQHVTFTNPSDDQPYLPPIKNYYDFHPSQLDYHRPSYAMHYCINPIHHKFTPIAHDAWLNYHKWK